MIKCLLTKVTLLINLLISAHEPQSRRGWVRKMEQVPHLDLQSTRNLGDCGIRSQNVGESP